MKKTIVFLLILVGLVAAAQGKSAKNNALGLWIDNSGDDWGIDWKMRQASDMSLNIYGHLYASDNETAISAYLGYYKHYYDLIKLDASAGRMPLYWGPYGGLGFWDNDYAHHEDNGLAIRLGLVGGLAWELPASVPFELWLELNPLAELHKVWSENDVGDEWDDTNWHIPELYIRMGVRVWLF